MKMAKGLLMYFDIDTGYYPGLHHGLAYLMGSVNKKNDVKFFHIFKEDHLIEVKDLIENNNWDFVGISFTAPSHSKILLSNFIIVCIKGILKYNPVPPTTIGVRFLLHCSLILLVAILSQ